MAKVGKERYHLQATSDGWKETGGEPPKTEKAKAKFALAPKAAPVKKP